jgi:hypothetical protein
VNPIIWAAIISGGWAAVVAAISYRFNRATAKATIQATNANALAVLDAGHEAQLWEKKAEAYVAALAAIHRRQVGRHHLIRPVRFDEATEERLLQSLAAPEETDWAQASAQLTAYAAQPVLDAMYAANEADNQVQVKLQHWKLLTDRVTAPVPGGPTGEQVIEALNAAQRAATAAKEADSAMEALIRADLTVKPSQRAALTQLAADPRRPR